MRIEEREKEMMGCIAAGRAVSSLVRITLLIGLTDTHVQGYTGANTMYCRPQPGEGRDAIEMQRASGPGPMLQPGPGPRKSLP